MYGIPGYELSIKVEIWTENFFMFPEFTAVCTLSHFVLITSGVIFIPVRVHSGSLFGSVFPVYMIPAPESVIPSANSPNEQERSFHFGTKTHSDVM